MRGSCRFLPFVAALGMLLPPGWCCTAPLQAADAAIESPHTPSLPACCAARLATSATSAAPAERKPADGLGCCSTNRSGTQCCCAKGRASLTSKERVASVDAVAVAVLPDLRSTLAHRAEAEPIVKPARNLQALLCCWRC